MSRWTFLHVPVHMITVGDFQSDWRKCNPIKSSKFNGDGKRHRSVPEVFYRGFAARSFGLRPKMCRPSATSENSRRTREKLVVPRVIAVVTLQTFYLGKHDLLTVYLWKLDFLSVTEFFSK